MFTVGQTNNSLQSQRVTFSLIYSPLISQPTVDDPIRGYLFVDPLQALRSSPYRQMLEMFAKMRVRKYSVSLWIPKVSHMVPGAMASILARDNVFFNRDTTAIPSVAPASASYSYEQLLLLPGVKHSRLYGVHTHNWRPIEPIDRNWFNTRISVGPDDERPQFGVLSFGMSLDNVNSIVTPDFSPLCKVTFDVDFAYLNGTLCDGSTVPRNVPAGPALPLTA